jgi:hypothetical protein
MKPWYQYVLDNLKRPLRFEDWSLRQNSKRFNRFVYRRMSRDGSYFIYRADFITWKGICGYHKED